MATRFRRSSVPLRVLGFALVASAVGCGSSNSSTFDGGTGDGGGSADGTVAAHDTGVTMLKQKMLPGENPDGSFSLDAFFEMDPPLMYCGFDGGTGDSGIGGTPMCPSDKNREGCPCTDPGMTAPCWPGLRADRNIGICHDGTTTCESSGEGLGSEWGICNGYQLPTSDAGGSTACKCFSSGQWLINNLSPCFEGTQGGSTYTAASTSQGAGGAVVCPPAAGANWSTDSATPRGPWTSTTA